MDRHFGGVIWTNHVLERLKQRGIKQSDAWAAWRRPDSSEYNSNKGVWVYQRNFGKEMIEIVAKKTPKNEWLILSVWSKNRHYINASLPLWKRIIKKILNI